MPDTTDPTGIDTWWLSFGHTTYFSIDQNGVVTSVTALAVSEYILGISVNDTYGNTGSDVVLITVEDTTLPGWMITPENQVVEYGDSFLYDVTATDLAGISHWWLNSTDFSIDAEGVITNATILSVKVYGLEVFVNDTHGNVLSATITITVEGPTTTTPTTTTSTTITTTPTSPTGTTPGGLDPMVILVLGGVGAVVVLVIVVVFMKKKS